VAILPGRGDSAELQCRADPVPPVPKHRCRAGDGERSAAQDLLSPPQH